MILNIPIQKYIVFFISTFLISIQVYADETETIEKNHFNTYITTYQSILDQNTNDKSISDTLWVASIAMIIFKNKYNPESYSIPEILSINQVLMLTIALGELTTNQLYNFLVHNNIVSEKEYANIIALLSTAGLTIPSILLSKKYTPVNNDESAYSPLQLVNNFSLSVIGLGSLMTALNNYLRINNFSLSSICHINLGTILASSLALQPSNMEASNQDISSSYQLKNMKQDILEATIVANAYKLPNNILFDRKQLLQKSGYQDYEYLEEICQASTLVTGITLAALMWKFHQPEFPASMILEAFSYYATDSIDTLLNISVADDKNLNNIIHDISTIIAQSAAFITANQLAQTNQKSEWKTVRNGVIVALLLKFYSTLGTHAQTIEQFLLPYFKNHSDVDKKSSTYPPHGEL